MKIAIDIDGVQYEWFDTALFLLKWHWGISVSSNKWEDIKAEIANRDDAPYITEWLFGEQAIRCGLYRHGDLVSGVIEAVTTLKKDNHSLIMVTNRPEAAVADTISWIDYTWGPYRPYPWSAIHILSNHESKSGVNADVLIDDDINIILDWVSYGRIGILFMRPWLKMTDEELDSIRGDNLLVAKGWYDVVEHIRKLSESE